MIRFLQLISESGGKCSKSKFPIGIKLKYVQMFLNLILIKNIYKIKQDIGIYICRAQDERI